MSTLGLFGVFQSVSVRFQVGLKELSAVFSNVVRQAASRQIERVARYLTCENLKTLWLFAL
jgi:hypothetical protein